MPWRMPLPRLRAKVASHAWGRGDQSMNKMELRRLRLGFVLLPVAVVVLVFAARDYIRSVGSRYELALDAYVGREMLPQNVSVLPIDMAEVLEIKTDAEGVPVVVLEGRHVGEGMLTVGLDDAGDTYDIRVDPGLVIISDGVNFTGWQAISLSVAVFFALCALLCLRSSIVLFRHAWYGYEMVGYVGSTIFCATQAAVFAWLTLSGEAKEFIDFALAITELASGFVGLTFAPMCVLAVLVCVSNIVLVHYEGFRPINLLGIAVSAAWALINGGFVYLRTLEIWTWEQFKVLTVVDSVLSIAVAFFETMLFGTCICAWLASRHVPKVPRDYLIILGCGIRADGTPTPLLAQRVDAALSFAHSQLDAGYDLPIFVPSGGQGANEVMSEAESMGHYLVGHGIHPSYIMLEDKSKSTRENMRFSGHLIAQDGGMRCPVAFATTNYHVFRGYVCAHDAGLDAEGISSPTRLYFWPNAFLREVVGLFASRAVPILLTLFLVSLFYILAEYIVLLG